ncbi:hypothetical protein Tco_0134378 [Tanacetum coccineum]
MQRYNPFRCTCGKGDIILRTSCLIPSVYNIMHVLVQSQEQKIMDVDILIGKTHLMNASETFWMWIFLWKEDRLRDLMSSPGAPSARPSTPSRYSSVPSTPPSYSSGPSTPQIYSPGSSRNAECKQLRGRISVLKATMEMHMHPEQHTLNSAALLHEVLNEMEKLDLE